MINIFMQQISHHWDQLMQHVSDQFNFTALDRPSNATGIPTSEFYNQTVDNNIDRHSFFESKPRYLNRHTNTGFVWNGGNCEHNQLFTINQDWFISTDPVDVYEFGILWHPLLRFVINLKYAKHAIHTNRTGHFRGTYMVGERMIADVLTNDNNWYMTKQIDNLKNVDHIIHQNCIPYIYKDELESDKQVYREQIQNFLYCRHLTENWKLDTDNWWLKSHGRHEVYRRWTRWLDRHIDMEMSAWHYIINSRELTDLLRQRYSEDFELGSFEDMTADYVDWA